jgi:hypothetical protein
MTLKQIGWALGILVVLALVFGWLASFSKPMAPAHEEATSPILHGTATTTGDFEYAEAGDGYKIDIIYPSKTGLAADADLRARTAMEQGLAGIVQDFKSNAATSLTPDELTRLQSMGTYYALSMEYKPYHGSTTVSYEFDVYEDTGGAHPNGYFKTFVFDQSGNELKLADLFVPGSDYLQKIAAAATAQVTKQLQAGLEQQDVSGAIFKEGLAPTDDNFQNFVIDNNDLVVLIPPYQVAAYVAGSFEIRIPLSQLVNELKN